MSRSDPAMRAGKASRPRIATRNIDHMVVDMRKSDSPFVRRFKIVVTKLRPPMVKEAMCERPERHASSWRGSPLNSPNLQQKATFKGDPRQEEAWRSGRSHIAAFTLGGPVVIPRVVNGRGKVFFFANYSKSDDSAPGRLAGTSTVPANRKHLEGDFSDLLLLPSGAGATTPAGHHQYQIYDPLTTRPDPLRPGRVIRDPFPGN